MSLDHPWTREHLRNSPSGQKHGFLLRHQGRTLSGFEVALGADGSKELDQPGNQSCPAGLVAGALAHAVDAMEIFIEENVVPPMGVRLKLFRPSENGTIAVFVSQKNAFQTRRLISRLTSKRVHHAPRSGGTFNFEVVSVIEIELEQGADDKRIHRKPDRSPPVGIAAEHAGVGFSGQIIDTIFRAVHVKDIGMVRMVAGQGTYPEGTQELVSPQGSDQDNPLISRSFLPEKRP